MLNVHIPNLVSILKPQLLTILHRVLPKCHVYLLWSYMSIFVFCLLSLYSTLTNIFSVTSLEVI